MRVQGHSLQYRPKAAIEESPADHPRRSTRDDGSRPPRRRFRDAQVTTASHDASAAHSCWAKKNRLTPAKNRSTATPKSDDGVLVVKMILAEGM